MLFYLLMVATAVTMMFVVHSVLSSSFPAALAALSFCCLAWAFALQNPQVYETYQSVLNVFHEAATRPTGPIRV